MGRILGLDYGKKKCGLSTTDPLQIIVTGLDTIQTTDLLSFLTQYCKNEIVDKIVIGKPTHKDGSDTYLVEDINKFVATINKEIPNLEIDFQDENLTSVEARDIIFRSGAKKSKRRDKSLVDKISAVIILQKYLRHI